MKSDIEAILDVVKEATAKTISAKLGLPQEDVAKELHGMHAEGSIERGKRKGGGSEYVYWLACANVPIVVENSIESDASVSGFDAAIERASSQPKELEVTRPDSNVDSALAKLCGQTRELLDVLGLPPTMTEAIAAARTMIDIAKATSTERDELKAENESNKVSAARWKLNCAGLERRIDELTLGHVGSRSPLFVTVGRYAKPMRHDSLEKAQKRGKALVRGDKESEVLVLEPVGRIVRGTEWRSK